MTPLRNGNLNDAALFGGSFCRVEHGHAMQYFLDIDGVGLLVLNAAGEFEQLSLKHVETGVLDELIGRRSYRTDWRVLR
jgi:hypothetical protein